MQLTGFVGDAVVVDVVVGLVTSSATPLSPLLRLFPDLRPDLRPPFFFFLRRYFFIGCSASNSDSGLLSAARPSSLWPVSHPDHSALLLPPVDG